MHLNVVTTLRCNLQCAHCIYGCPQDVDLPMERLHHVVERLLEHGLAAVTFTGGEPILHPGLPAMVDFVARLGLGFGFVSNGARQEDYESLLGRHRMVSKEIALSLDGLERSHDKVRGQGSFRQVLAGLRRFAAQRIPTTLNVTVRDETVYELPAIVSLAASHGATGVKVAGLLPNRPGGPALSSEHREALHDRAESLTHRYGIPVNVANSVFHPVTLEFCPVLTRDVITLDPRGALAFCCDIPGYAGRLAGPGADPQGVLPKRQAIVNEILLARIVEARQGDMDADRQSCLFCHEYFGAQA